MGRAMEEESRSCSPPAGQNMNRGRMQIPGHEGWSWPGGQTRHPEATAATHPKHRNTPAAPPSCSRGLHSHHPLGEPTRKQRPRDPTQAASRRAARQVLKVCSRQDPGSEFLSQDTCHKGLVRACWVWSTVWCVLSTPAWSSVLLFSAGLWRLVLTPAESLPTPTPGHISLSLLLLSFALPARISQPPPIPCSSTDIPQVQKVMLKNTVQFSFQTWRNGVLLL